jgi:hypothetical protein
VAGHQDKIRIARRADLGGSRVPRHVAAGSTANLVTIIPTTCTVRRPRSAKKPGTFLVLNLVLT